MRQKILTIAGTFILPVVLLSVVWLFDSTPAIQAAAFDVCATGCPYTTIGEAVDDLVNVPNGSVINVLAGTYTDTVLLTRTMTIQGQGAGITIIDGDAAGSVLEVDDGISATIKSLTIQNGSSVSGGGVVNDGTVTIVNSVIQNNETPCDDGGGIVNFGSMTLQHVIVSGNSSSAGGGIFNDGLVVAENITITLNGTVTDFCGSTGGGIENSGTFYLTNSVVQNNESAGDGGGIENAGTLTVSLSAVSDNTSQAEGGGIDNVVGGTMTVVSSTVRNNDAEYGGGLNNEGDMWLTNSVVHNNTATNTASSSGGGIRNEAGGILTSTNSTVSENTASQGGGLYNEGSGATAVFRSSTLYNNSGSPGGGIGNIIGTVTLSNSIIAHVSGQALGFDCSGGGIISSGSNMDSDDSCGLGQNDLRGIASPWIGSLQDNGGPTWTNALLVGSPAIDATNVCESTDQRGVARPVGNLCDIGAYETKVFRIYLPVILRN